MRIILILVVVLAWGCAGSIETVHDPKTDFSKYKTFCWMDGCKFKFSGATHLTDTTLAAKVEKAIIEELALKGLTFSSEEPDLLIGVTVTLQDEKAIVYHRSENQPYYQPLKQDSEVITYLKGTLVIGMADRRESRIVWESFASRYMDLNPEFTEENVRKGIKLVLEKYPPQEEEQ